MLGKFSFDDIICDYNEFAIIWIVNDIQHYEIIISDEILSTIIKEDFIPNS